LVQGRLVPGFTGCRPCGPAALGRMRRGSAARPWNGFIASGYRPGGALTAATRGGCVSLGVDVHLVMFLDGKGTSRRAAMDGPLRRTISLFIICSWRRSRARRRRQSEPARQMRRREKSARRLEWLSPDGLSDGTSAAMGQQRGSIEVIRPRVVRELREHEPARFRE